MAYYYISKSVNTQLLSEKLLLEVDDNLRRNMLTGQHTENKRLWNVQL